MLSSLRPEASGFAAHSALFAVTITCILTAKDAKNVAKKAKSGHKEHNEHEVKGIFVQNNE